MPKQLTKYACEFCGKLFDHYNDAWECEDSHPICRQCKFNDSYVGSPFHFCDKKFNHIESQTYTCPDFSRKEGG